MTLGYSKRDTFKDDILAGIKIHTIREDPGRRWRQGMKIHHVTGNRSKKRHQFLLNNCTGTQAVIFQIKKEACGFPYLFVWVDGRNLSSAGREILAINDGFKSWADMEPFAAALCAGRWRQKSKSLVMIHWTNYRY